MAAACRPWLLYEHFCYRLLIASSVGSHSLWSAGEARTVRSYRLSMALIRARLGSTSIPKELFEEFLQTMNVRVQSEMRSLSEPVGALQRQ